jgi:hypothetical protein
MKTAYHFNTDDESIGDYYGFDIKAKIFNILLNHRSLSISTKIFVGDLMIRYLASDTEKIDEFVTRKKFNIDKYNQIFSLWQNPENYIWRKFSQENVFKTHNNNVYVICLESIDLKTAEHINSELEIHSSYLGAMEIDDASMAHWAIYGEALIPFGRIYNKNLNLFHQEGDEIEESDLDEYKQLPFTEVNFECLNWKYTIFDTFSGFEEARRISEWKRNSGALLAFIADDIVSKLSDIAPDIGNKLWSTLKTFEEAETNEQLAQVTASCRRIFEYVTDSIFPPTSEKMDGHSLKAGNYKNRLYAYADSTRKSNTNIDLIIATTQTLFEQWEKLNQLSNKGIHSEVFRPETRSCLLRTIMLLDDIVSLKEKPFEIKPNLDFEKIFKK